MFHPALGKLEAYSWIVNRCAEADRVLGGLVLANAPAYLIRDHQDEVNRLLVELGHAHDAVVRCLAGR
jgi:hypothetical protein